jgi:hypothetical protein
MNTPVQPVVFEVSEAEIRAERARIRLESPDLVGPAMMHRVDSFIERRLREMQMQSALTPAPASPEVKVSDQRDWAVCAHDYDGSY